MPKVGIIMGSDSDLSIMKEAGDMLSELGIEYEYKICSAHRLPYETAEYAAHAEEKGFDVIIAGAGGAAHLPGVIAAYTVLPVIGVPVFTKTLSGVDSLYSIVQMPKGIPVATVAINGSANAGILAAQIIAVKDEEVRSKLKKYRQDMANGVLKKDQKLNEIGVNAYLENMK
ncbi:MAG: 5-(carboxyamino)imidazole ribonucleotide mutase [Syntrophomonadaceae bacterium]|nr:5-(carboxyamino)imidazole ribonucleotide mutase [Syntrophomonadaceae bacterium]